MAGEARSASKVQAFLWQLLLHKPCSRGQFQLELAYLLKEQALDWLEKAYEELHSASLSECRSCVAERSAARLLWGPGLGTEK